MTFILVGQIGCVPTQDPTSVKSALEFDNLEYVTPTPFVVSSGQKPVVAHSFEFRNAGEEAVRITSVIPGCASCTTTRFPTDAIPPNTSGRIQVEVDLRRRAKNFRLPLVVRTDEAGGASLGLLVSTYVVNRPFASPSALDLGEISAETTVTRVVQITVPLGPGESVEPIQVAPRTGAATVTGITQRAEEDPFHGAVATHEVGIALQATMAGAELQDMLEVSIVGRDAPVLVPVRATCVHPNLRADPRLINFGLVGPAGVDRRIRVALKNELPVEQLRVTSSDSRVTASVGNVHDDPRQATLLVTMTLHASEFCRGELLVTTGQDPVPLHVPYLGYSAKEP